MTIPKAAAGAHQDPNGFQKILTGAFSDGYGDDEG